MPVNLNTSNAQRTNQQDRTPSPTSGQRAYAAGNPTGPHRQASSAKPEISTRLAEREIKLTQPPSLSKHAGNPSIMLNGQVTVDGTRYNATDSGQVMCRHLAREFATHSDGHGIQAKKSTLMPTYSTQEGISDKFEGRLSGYDSFMKTEKTNTDNACKHTISNHQFGDYLCATSKQLTSPMDPGPSEVNCLMSDENHMVAINVQRKCKDDKEYISVKLYDPNTTATYKTVARENPDDLKNIKLSDMLTITNALGKEKSGRPLSLQSLHSDVKPDFNRNTIEATPKHMNMALQNGSLHDINQILEKNSSFDILQAKNSKDIPGISNAVHNNDAFTVKNFVYKVLTTPLPPAQQENLLTATVNGSSVLATTRAIENDDIAEYMTKAILGSSLSPKRKTRLLEAKNDNGYSTLQTSMKFGTGKTIENFVQQIADSTLSREQKVSLIKANTHPSGSGLVKAFEAVNTSTVVTYTQAVLGSKLNVEDKVELLAGKDHANTTIFSTMAQDSTRTEPTIAFFDTVMASSLTKDQKAVILG